jgi:hypothetical protein
VAILSAGSPQPSGLAANPPFLTDLRAWLTRGGSTSTSWRPPLDPVTGAFRHGRS